MNHRTNISKKIEFYNKSIPKKQEEVRLFEQSLFDKWSLITFVKFIYTYCDNDFNKKNNRVGRISSFRIGTRNVDLIPADDKPTGVHRGSAKAYYDVSRAGTTVTNGITSGGIPGKVLSNAAQLGQWRSFQPKTFSIMIEVWSFEKEKWVSDLKEFNNNDTNTG